MSYALGALWAIALCFLFKLCSDQWNMLTEKRMKNDQ